jgi:hypothetical protein
LKFAIGEQDNERFIAHGKCLHPSQNQESAIPHVVHFNVAKNG